MANELTQTDYRPPPALQLSLPNEPVVHKRTAFTTDEQRGLLQGLEGVPNIELIEVTIEESLRYLASKMSNGKPEIDTFPIPRGAVVVLDKTSALLWVHGATPNASNPSWKYYQGKRRIPTPSLIRRFHGQSDVTQVATEILGLSKMNWNTFDYYSRLPAHVGLGKRNCEGGHLPQRLRLGSLRLQASDLSDGLIRALARTSGSVIVQIGRMIEFDAPKTALELETLVRGVFDKRRFLDLVRNFIVFEDDPDTGAVHKLVAGYHQFHAVKAAIDETSRHRSRRDGEG